MSGIAEAHAYLAENILQGLAISSPVEAAIKKAWPYFPPKAKVLADVPASIVTFEQRPVVFGPALLHKPYTFHIQVFAAPHEDALGPGKAAAFMDALITKLSSTSETIRLGTANTVVQQLRGETPETLAVLEWAGRAYIGLDLYLDITITGTPGYSA